VLQPNVMHQYMSAVSNTDTPPSVLRTATSPFRGGLAVAVLALLLCCWIANAFAQSLQPIPALAGPVVDTTGSLTADEEAGLETRLIAYAKAKGSQVQVLIVPTTAPEDIAQYSIRVVDTWKLGRAKQDDGVLLLVAKDDRRLRIEVGYGLEGAIPDARSNQIITQIITPKFRGGDFYGGIHDGVDAITKLIDGENLPAPEPSLDGIGRPDFMSAVIVGVIFGVVTGGIVRGLLGRFLSTLGGAGLAGFIAFSVAGMFAGGVLAALITAIMMLFGRSGGGGGGGWYSGGGLGGGGWSSGGGGSSWGGGGGGFGGGGSSGSW
jgi:uncharacterized protein